MEREGKRVLTGEVWENYFPAVITEEEWYRLRASRKRRTYQRGPAGKEVANLFTGLLFNAVDRQPYHRIVKNHPRLISASYRNGLPGGDTQSFPYEVFETAFLSILSNDLSLRDLFIQRRASDNESSSIEAELEDLNGRIALVKERVATDPGVAVMLDVLTDLDRKRKVLLARREETRTRHVDVDHEEEAYEDLRAFAKLMDEDHEDLANLRTRLKATISRVVSEIWMVVIGKKRSKFKSAYVHVFLKSGGMWALFITAERERLKSVEPHGIEPVTEVPFQRDLRLYSDPVRGVNIRKLVEYTEKLIEFRRSGQPL
jgi:hypothetical protein